MHYCTCITLNVSAPKHMCFLPVFVHALMSVATVYGNRNEKGVILLAEL